MKRILRALSLLPALVLTAWGTAALAFRGPSPILAGAYAVAALAVLVWVRPLWRGVVAWTVLFAALLVWWGSIEPRNDRDWQAEVARAPHGELHGDLLTLYDVRNFDYRSETDFTPQYYDRTYDLRTLRGLDLVLSYWAGPEIAHTIMVWEFTEGPPLAISIETRKEKGEEYSAVLGFFKQYELFYVAADERDLVRLRTNYRGEHVYLYHLTTPIADARALLLDYVARMNALWKTPEFYDALTQNCTTTIRAHAHHIGAGGALNWRLLVNGYLDELLYERGVLDRSLPFPELKRVSLIDAKAQAADQDPAFSERIREGLPVPPLPPPP